MKLSITLSRYLIRHFLRWFMIVGSSLTSIILLFDFTEFIRKTSGKSFINFNFIVQMVFLKLPMLLQQLLPFVILFTSILMFWYLNRSHELEIMRVSGISVWQILKPVALTALLVGIIDLTIFNPIASRFMLRYEHLYDFYFNGNKGSLAVSDSGLWLREVDDDMQIFFHIKNVDVAQKKLFNITIFQNDAHDRFLKRFDAREAIFDNDKVKLYGVWGSAPEQAPEFIAYYEISTTLTFKGLQNCGANPYSLSLWDLPSYTGFLEKSGLNGLKYRLHWHSLIARAAWLGVMVILAASCALRPMRQGRTMIMIISGITAAFILYLLKDISYAMGSSGQIPLILAAWSPVLISFLLSITALIHFEES